MIREAKVCELLLLSTKSWFDIGHPSSWHTLNSELLEHTSPPNLLVHPDVLDVALMLVRVPQSSSPVKITSRNTLPLPYLCTVDSWNDFPTNFRRNAIISLFTSSCKEI